MRRQMSLTISSPLSWRRTTETTEEHNLERRYTISEIDQMRKVVGEKMDWQPEYVSECSSPGGWSKPTPESVASCERWTREVEDKLRTYLIAGVDPAEFVSPGTGG